LARAGGHELPGCSVTAHACCAELGWCVWQRRLLVLASAGAEVCQRISNPPGSERGGGAQGLMGDRLRLRRAARSGASRWTGARPRGASCATTSTPSWSTLWRRARPRPSRRLPRSCLPTCLAGAPGDGAAWSRAKPAPSAGRRWADVSRVVFGNSRCWRRGGRRCLA